MDTSMFLFAAEGEIHWSIVCLIGVSVVFVGLACIIGLVELMTLICNKILERGDKKKPATIQAQPQASALASNGVIENRGEILAAVCAAIAEEEGTDISAIRVISFKKL
ncbi:MAG: OadG family protein [Clostridia bacterium]|nr:OadG family protein [Clostridia bacterium]